MAKIFLCHASEDRPQVEEIYRCLRKEGYQPWMDKTDLLPGQQWQQEIPKVLRTADFILLFLSRNSITKRGYIQREFKLALDTLQEIPEDIIHTIPVRLDDWDIPEQFKFLHWCNLFEEDGYEKLLQAIQIGLSQRQQQVSGGASDASRKTEAANPIAFSNKGGWQRFLRAIRLGLEQRLQPGNQGLPEALRKAETTKPKDAQAQGIDLRYDLILILEEAMFGVVKTLAFEKRETCLSCSGKPLESLKCSYCNGQGITTVKAKFSVKIPAGVDNGSRVLVRGKGESRIPGATPGDLFVVLTVKEHEKFKRIDNDLFTELSVDTKTATHGGLLPLKVIGKVVKVRVPPNITSNRSLRLAGLGVPDIKTGKRGDLYCSIIISDS
jgi:hypothetical protein